MFYNSQRIAVLGSCVAEERSMVGSNPRGGVDLHIGFSFLRFLRPCEGTLAKANLVLIST